MHEAGEKVTHERRKKGSKYRESNGQEEGGTKRERVIGEREREKKRERDANEGNYNKTPNDSTP
jgi:hypothetical protein